MRTLGHCLVLAVLSIMWAMSPRAHAEVGAAAGPSGGCINLPGDGWLDSEIKAWKDVLASGQVNFGHRPGYRTVTERRGWDENQRLTSHFLETVLIDPECVAKLPRTGLRLNGVWFSSAIDLSQAHVLVPISIKASRFEGKVNLDRSTFEGAIEISKSFFAEALYASGASFNNDLLLTEDVGQQSLELVEVRVEGRTFTLDNSYFPRIVLDGARISGSIQASQIGKSVVDTRLLQVHALSAKVDIQSTPDVTLDGASVEQNVVIRSSNVRRLSANRIRVRGDMNLTTLHIAHDLTMAGATIDGYLDMGGGSSAHDISLVSAKIKQRVVLTHIFVRQMLNMAGLETDGDLFLNERSNFFEVILSNAHVGANLNLSQSVFDGFVDLFQTRVDRSLYIGGNSEFNDKLQMIQGKVGRYLDMAGGDYRSVDLSGTTIDGSLVLASVSAGPAKWDQARGVLILRDVRVATIEDLPNAWPVASKCESSTVCGSALELDGFAYQRFVGVGSEEERALGMAGRPVCTIVEWLDSDRTFSPQPFLMASEVLRNAGQAVKANDISYARSVREQRDASWPYKIFLWVSWLLIGYGIGAGYLWALIWSVAFTGTGWLVLHLNGETDSEGRRLGLLYSLDRLLPLISLEGNHKDVILRSVHARTYFAIHTIAGFVLASCILAGLALLTK